MSGFFGIFNRNSRTVEKKTVTTMLEAMSYWEPDEKSTWINGPVALGHTMLWNTPESKYEHLPLEKDIYVLTMDARIDNREELIEELELPDRPLEETGDSEFILAAYVKWGEDCTKHLLGDFAFAIWDERKKEIFCARDHIGIKSFYYYIDDSTFIFSNDIRVLFANKNIPKTIDDCKVYHYLIEAYNPSLTFFKTIKKLDSAATFKVGMNNYKKLIYWKAENSAKIELASIEDYANKLRELLESAVSVRTRSTFPVASHLSGGLDSSTIAVLSHRELKKNNKQLYTYNWTYHDGTDYYEWNNSHKIAISEGIEHTDIKLDEHIIRNFYLTKNIIFNDMEFMIYEDVVRKKANKQNVKTILSGWGGDELITNHGGGYYTEVFWKVNPFYAIYKLYKEETGSTRRFLRLLKMCYQLFVRPIYKKFGKQDTHNYENLYCTQSNFNHCKALKSTNHKPIASFSSRNRKLDMFNSGHIVNRIESWTSASFEDRMEYRYPLLDKRLIEFALGIPSELYRMNGYGRYLFRYSIKGILSDEFRWNTVKSEPKRVAILLEVMFSAQLKIIKESYSEDCAKNIFIDFSKLYDLAIETQKIWKEQTLYWKANKVFLIHHSLMIYKLKVVQ